MPCTAYIDASMLNGVVDALRVFQDTAAAQRSRDRAQQAAKLLADPLLMPLLGTGGLKVDDSAVLVVANSLVMHARHTTVASKVTLMHDGRERIFESVLTAAEAAIDADEADIEEDDVSFQPAVTSTLAAEGLAVAPSMAAGSSERRDGAQQAASNAPLAAESCGPLPGALQLTGVGGSSPVVERAPIHALAPVALCAPMSVSSPDSVPHAVQITDLTPQKQLRSSGVREDLVQSEHVPDDLGRQLFAKVLFADDGADDEVFDGAEDAATVESESLTEAEHGVASFAAAQSSGASLQAPPVAFESTGAGTSGLHFGPTQSAASAFPRVTEGGTDCGTRSDTTAAAAAALSSAKDTLATGGAGAIPDRTSHAKDLALAHAALFTQLGTIGAFIVTRHSQTQDNEAQGKRTGKPFYTCTCSAFLKNRRTVVAGARTCPHILRARMSVLNEREASLTLAEESSDAIVFHKKATPSGNPRRIESAVNACQGIVTAARDIEMILNTTDKAKDPSYCEAVHALFSFAKDVRNLGHLTPVPESASPPTSLLRASKHTHQDGKGTMWHAISQGKRQAASRPDGAAPDGDDDDETNVYGLVQYISEPLQKRKRAKGDYLTEEKRAMRGATDASNILANVDISTVDKVPKPVVDGGVLFLPGLLL